MDITRELVKELKDAGFPQRFKRGSYYAEKASSFKEAQKAHTFFDSRAQGTPESDLASDKLISIPTLEEVIEELGERFHCLVYSNEKDFWSAGATNEVRNWKNGKTPLEAVVNLYIAINKK